MYRSLNLTPNKPLSISKNSLDEYLSKFDLPEGNPIDANKGFKKASSPNEQVILAKFWWSGMGSCDYKINDFLSYCEGNCVIYTVGEDGTPFKCYHKTDEGITVSNIVLVGDHLLTRLKQAVIANHSEHAMKILDSL